MVHYYQSPIGIIATTIKNDKVTNISFGDEDIPTDVQSESPIFKEVTEQYTAYFKGERQKLSLPYSIQKGTDFQKKIWEIVSTIPYGSTRTYKQIAIQLGDVKKVRAVGTAIGANPLLVLIPCHRVIGSGGNLVGYAGGLERKKKLLQLEGAISQKELF